MKTYTLNFDNGHQTKGAYDIKRDYNMYTFKVADLSAFGGYKCMQIWATSILSIEEE